MVRSGKVLSPEAPKLESRSTAAECLAKQEITEASNNLGDEAPRACAYKTSSSATSSIGEDQIDLEPEPVSREATRCDGVARRRTSLRLTEEQCLSVLNAADYAITIGLPLNRFITLDAELMGAGDPVRFAGEFLRRAKQWLRSHDAATSSIFVQERGLQMGAHLHLLMSVPPHLAGGFARRQRGWVTACGARNVRGGIKTRHVAGSPKTAFNYHPLAQVEYRRELAKLVSYILKDADDPAHKRLGIKHESLGGETIGKRVGTSQNIGRAARGAARHVPLTKVVDLAGIMTDSGRCGRLTAGRGADLPPGAVPAAPTTQCSARTAGGALRRALLASVCHVALTGGLAPSRCRRELRAIMPSDPPPRSAQMAPAPRKPLLGRSVA